MSVKIDQAFALYRQYSGADLQTKSEIKSFVLNLILSLGPEDDTCNVNEDGVPVLILALRHGHTEVAKLLIEANFNHPYINSAFATAVGCGQVDMVELIIRNSSKFNVRNRNCANVFALAIEKNRIDLVLLLIRYGADINAQDSLGFSALHFALLLNMGDIAKLLIQHKANINVVDKWHKNELAYAGLGDKVNNARLLMQSGIDIGAGDLSFVDLSAIYGAIQDGIVVKYLRSILLISEHVAEIPPEVINLNKYQISAILESLLSDLMSNKDVAENGSVFGSLQDNYALLTVLSSYFCLSDNIQSNIKSLVNITGGDIYTKVANLADLCENLEICLEPSYYDSKVQDEAFKIAKKEFSLAEENYSYDFKALAKRLNELLNPELLEAKFDEGNNSLNTLLKLHHDSGWSKKIADQREVVIPKSDEGGGCIEKSVRDILAQKNGVEVGVV